ncbi:hypothetical protein KCP69_26150 [Salmonella enterica subsp. enterica]|nr:hypothetical protein KCP69_26150 [Salmonella enterica subsp. enterica]
MILSVAGCRWWWRRFGVHQHNTAKARYRRITGRAYFRVRHNGDIVPLDDNMLRRGETRYRHAEPSGLRVRYVVGNTCLRVRAITVISGLTSFWKGISLSLNPPKETTAAFGEGERNYGEEFSPATASWWRRKFARLERMGRCRYLSVLKG